VLVTDDKGRTDRLRVFLADDQTNMTESGCLPPGFESTGTVRFYREGPPFHIDEFESNKWHLFFTGGGEAGGIVKEPMDETVITIPDDIPERFDPSR
jgi:hypothetical protein